MAANPLPGDGPVLLRFSGVEIDAARHRLAVDGRDVRVQRLVFNLLLALCDAQGRVLSRDELFAKLWPDDTFPADESLSQLVFKLRGALGRYGSAVVTVRQVGVRLDADIERIPIILPEPRDMGSSGADVDTAPQASDRLTSGAENVPGPPPSETDPKVAALPATLPTQAARSLHFGWPRLVWVAVTLVLLALLANVLITRSAPLTVSAGFGLDSNDVQASDERTLDILRRAFDADADGKQSTARVLMETAHAAGSRTPVPAMFLTYWYGGLGETVAAERWAAERDHRINPETPTYVVLLARFLAMRDATALERLKLESLLLETKPNAALIRLARAHHHLQRNERQAALVHLRQVDLRATGRRRAPMVLGDLVALGDHVAVEHALKSAGDILDAPGLAYAQARLHVSQRRYAQARLSFDQVLTLAKSEERPDLLRGSAMHAAMMSAELGEFVDARQRIERAIQALRDERAYVYAWHSTLVLATLPSISAAEAHGLLERLAIEVPADARSTLCLDVELVAATLRLDPPQPLRCDSDQSDEYARRGGRALAAALRAQLANDPATARSELARAESEGVRETVHAPYADLLLARLNGTLQTADIPDPPYPAWHRWALRWRDAQRIQ